MGLSSTLNIAQSALATNAALTTVVSRNIAGVNDPNYSRKIANVSTGPTGIAVLSSVTRATDAALFANLLTANADAASSQAIADGLDKLENTVNLTGTTSTDAGTATNASPAGLLSAFTAALQQYESSPGDTASAQAVITAAKSLSGGLNAASATVQAVRTQADKDIATSVATVNTLLGQFQTVNADVVKAGTSAVDPTDALDARSKILTALSQEIGITTTVEPNGSMGIFTDSGVTLFQGTPRTVSFSATGALAAGTGGGGVSVDGVPVTGSSAVMAIKSGRVAGLTQLRDTTTVAYQDQLDQIASGLVSAFSESDQTGGTAPTIPGLFTYAGAPAMPSAGQVGLSSGIAVSASVDPSRGGVIARLRDGGIGDPGNAAYVANTSGAAGYSAHLVTMLAALDGGRTFDPASGGAAQGTLGAYAASSVAWLEAARQGATKVAGDRSAAATQTASSLSSETGVNLDEQLSKMLDLEHSYKASAELISTVRNMYASLLQAVQ